MRNYKSKLALRLLTLARAISLPVTNKESPNSSLIVAWILASVAKSMELVASSKTITELRRRRALAIAISWRCPCEKLLPPADTFVSSETVVFASTSVADVDAIETVSWIEAAREDAGEECSETVLEATRDVVWL